MTFVILLSHPRAVSDSNGYVEGMGGEPYAQFRFPEKLILVSLANVEEKSIPGQSNQMLISESQFRFCGADSLDIVRGNVTT